MDFYESPIGVLKVVVDDENLLEIRLVDKIGSSNPNVMTNKVIDQLKEYFLGKRTSFDIPIKLDGSEYQKQVWQGLIAIPYGETRTYEELAEAIGNPKSCRAVGNANNKNKILIVVPCHRVIGKNGTLTGFAAGLGAKEYLLNLEKRI